jgi:hypothetical protein
MIENKLFKEHDVLIVESPLQLLSAIEAIKYFDFKRTCLIVRYADARRRKRHNSHIDEVLKMYDFNRVIKLRNSSSNTLNKLLKFNSYLWFRINRKSIRKLAIGEWRSEWMQRCTEIAQKDSVILLDDGVIVVDILRNKIEKGVNFNVNTDRSKSVKQRLKTLIFSILGTKGVYDKKYHLFTAFFSKTDSKTVQITPNRYEFVRSKVEDVNADGIYYFGTKYSEAGYFPLSVELRFLGHVFSTLSNLYPTEQAQENNRILYVPHRDDSVTKLEAVKEIGFDVTPLNCPAEIYFFLMKKKPKVIAGAFTTAVANVSTIYKPDAVHLFKLPIEEIAKEKREHVESIYKFYEERKYQIVE